MSLEDGIHQLVLGMDGVAAVYTADPVWLTAVKQLGSLLSPGEAAPVPFVVCSEKADDAGEPGAAPAMSVRVRIGTDGSLPAPALARSVAAGIRAHLAVLRPGVDVKAVVEISAIGV